MQLIGGFTFRSQPSSSDESCEPDEEYHEPAWLGSRMVVFDDIADIVQSGERRAREGGGAIDAVLV